MFYKINIFHSFVSNFSIYPFFSWSPRGNRCLELCLGSHAVHRFRQVSNAVHSLGPSFQIVRRLRKASHAVHKTIVKCCTVDYTCVKR